MEELTEVEALEAELNYQLGLNDRLEATISRLTAERDALRSIAREAITNLDEGKYHTAKTTLRLALATPTDPDADARGGE